jgi:outer membrane protein insertion porin family
VDVRRRWLSDPRNQTGLSLFAYRRSAPGVFTDQGGGAAATFTRDVSRGLPVSGTYRFELTNVQAADVYFCANFGVCDASSRSVLTGTQRLAPLALTASMDRRDDPLGATRGFAWRSEFEIADRFTGSSIWYSRAEVEGTLYIPATERLVVAMRGRGGIVAARSNPALGTSRAVIHPRKRFYAGGAQSVRGYGENQLGPRVLAIPRINLQPPAALYDSIVAGQAGDRRRIPCAPTQALLDCRLSPDTIIIGGAPRVVNDFGDSDFSPKPLGGDQLLEGSIEGRYQLKGQFSLAVFLDFATLRSRESISGGSVQTSVTAFTPGFGVRYRSPVGPVRLDLGFNPKSVESLSVITESGVWDSESVGRSSRWVLRTPGLATLNSTRAFNPATGAGLGGIFNRVTVHLSIGEAF